MVGRTKCRARQEHNTSPAFGRIAVIGLHVRARYDHQSPIMPGPPVYLWCELAHHPTNYSLYDCKVISR